ncbi:MAG: 13E12 repeat family protein, partial [Actinomycetota bacterium]|nr:13E12 repeat family protein [Actinomycetota bacterium]
MSAPAPAEEVIDCLVEDRPGAVEPVRWSEYLPDGLLADLLAQPAETGPERREFEVLERVGAWERVIAWAQARQAREMTSFMDSATARNRALGACDSQVHDSAVAEVGLMLAASARTAACRVGDAWSLCTRLPATLAALEAGRITLAKARVIDTETLNLSQDHTAAVEEQVLAKARQQTPGQLRAATRRAVLSTDPAAAQE